MDDELRKPIKWDRPCYKCGSHYCDLSCPDRAKNANAAPQDQDAKMDEIRKTLKLGMNIGKALREGINEDIAKDAARFRWLEQNVYQGVSRFSQVLWCIRGLFGKDGESFGEAIDAAMQQEQKP